MKVNMLGILDSVQMTNGRWFSKLWKLCLTVIIRYWTKVNVQLGFEPLTPETLLWFHYCYAI